MSVEAYIKDNNVRLYFDNEEFSLIREFDYSISEQLLNFIWFPIDRIEKEFEALDKLYTEKNFNKDSENYSHKSVDFDIKEIAIGDRIDNYCCYLHFYTQNLMWFFNAYTELKTDIISMPDILNRFLSNGLSYIKTILNIEAEYLDEEELEIHLIYSQLYNCCLNKTISIETQKQVFRSAIELTLIDIIFKRNAIKEEIDLLLNEDKELEGLSSLQRLCYIDLGRDYPLYINKPFNMILKQFPKAYSNENDISGMLKSIIECKSTIVPMYPIKAIDDLITIEMYNIFANELTIRKCKYCSHYFIPENRSDSDYCNRIKENESKPCNTIGPKRIYDLKTKNDPITKAHHKAYNRMRAKLRTNRISKVEFCDWSDKATYMREQCKAGNISFDEYEVWLVRDKISLE